MDKRPKIITLYGESEISATPRKRIVDRKYVGNQIVWVQECLTFGRTTRNGNDFLEENFREAIEDPFVNDRIKGNRFFSELDHPSKSDTERFVQVFLQNIAYRNKRFFFENGTMYSECETIDTPSGKIVRTLIESDAEIAVSFRGYGVPKINGNGETIKLVAFDVVYQPSDPTSLSKEESFRNQMYAEGYSASEFARIAMRDNLVAYDTIPKNSGLYAEASFEGIRPKQVIKYGDDVLGITYETKEEIERNAKAQGFRNFIVNL